MLIKKKGYDLKGIWTAILEVRGRVIILMANNKPQNEKWKEKKLIEREKIK